MPPRAKRRGAQTRSTASKKKRVYSPSQSPSPGSMPSATLDIASSSAMPEMLEAQRAPTPRLSEIPDIVDDDVVDDLDGFIVPDKWESDREEGNGPEPSDDPRAHHSPGTAPNIEEPNMPTVGSDDDANGEAGHEVHMNQAPVPSDPVDPVGPAVNDHGTDDGDADEDQLVLRECLALTSDGTDGKLVTTADLQLTMPSDAEARQRIERILQHPGFHKTALNLAKVDPGSLIYDRSSNGKRRKQIAFANDPNRSVVFSLTGMVTHFSFDRPADLPKDKAYPQQVCVAPFKDGFARALAILRHKFGTPYLFMNCYRNGVSFSTGRFFKLPNDRGGLKKPVLPCDVKIPLLDARQEPLKWKTYYKLPALPQTALAAGMTCAVLFTAGAYQLIGAKAGIQTGMVEYAASLNIQALVVLHDADKAVHPTAVRPFDLDYTGVQRDPDLTLSKALTTPPEVQPVAAPASLEANDVDEEDDDEL